MKKLDSKFCAAIGASADWGIICNWFLRLFDVANHDIAKSRSQIDCMIETLDAVFVNGSVFQRLFEPASGGMNSVSRGVAFEEPLPQVHPAVDAGGVEVGFITAKVVRNLRKKFVFYAGGLPVLLWGELKPDESQELLHRLHNVASLTKERLLADFPRDDVRSALAVFDRRLVQKGFGPFPDSDVRRFLLRGTRQLAGLLGCEEAAAVLQYNGVLPYMLRQMAPLQPLAEKTNQEAWATLLDDEVWDHACPNRLRATSGSLARLIRFYISIEDGECTVERDLGLLREHLLEHRTSDIAFLNDCLVMKLCGPKTTSEFDDGTVDSSVELTPFSRECASLWRQLFGLRVGHYNGSATAASKSKRLQPDGLLRRSTLGVLAAARLAVAAARSKSRQARSSGSVPSPGAGAARSALWNDRMTKFKQRSNRNIPGCTVTRAKPGSAFLVPASVDLNKREGASTQVLPRKLPYNPAVAIVGVSSEEMCPAAGCRIVSGVHRCAKVDLAIVPDLSMLHNVDALSADVDLVVSFLYIVSLGVDVSTTTQLAAAMGCPRRLSSLQRVRHVAAVSTKFTFFVGSRLRIEEEDVLKALSLIARTPGSKYVVSTAVAASGADIVFNCLRDVVTWASSVRRAVNSPGPKAFVVD